mmetsp:Transcript_4493/g.7955  ORF Transcript_4493/g.7955 Transcript_4493/m.7955 type:complete len:285 (-) Transcript_4493:2163-3017(-)
MAGPRPPEVRRAASRGRTLWLPLPQPLQRSRTQPPGHSPAPAKTGPSPRPVQSTPPPLSVPPPHRPPAWRWPPLPPLLPVDPGAPSGTPAPCPAALGESGPPHRPRPSVPWPLTRGGPAATVATGRSVLPATGPRPAGKRTATAAALSLAPAAHAPPASAGLASGNQHPQRGWGPRPPGRARMPAFRLTWQARQPRHPLPGPQGAGSRLRGAAGGKPETGILLPCPHFPPPPLPIPCWGHQWLRPPLWPWVRWMGGWQGPPVGLAAAAPGGRRGCGRRCPPTPI